MQSGLGWGGANQCLQILQSAISLVLHEGLCMLMHGPGVILQSLQGVHALNAVQCHTFEDMLLSQRLDFMHTGIAIRCSLRQYNK